PRRQPRQGPARRGERRVSCRRRFPRADRCTRRGRPSVRRQQAPDARADRPDGRRARRARGRGARGLTDGRARADAAARAMSMDQPEHRMNGRSESAGGFHGCGERDPGPARALVHAALAALLALGGGQTAAQETGKPAPQFAVDEGPGAAAEFRTLDEEVQELKKLAVDLNRDLCLLEEELLFPASTQVSVFVSMDVGAFFGLDSVEVKLDGKDVASYLYTEREVDALHRGGVQRLFTGNVRAGEH